MNQRSTESNHLTLGVDYESDYGEYNEVIDDVEEEVFADTQLSLEGVLV